MATITPEHVERLLRGLRRCFPGWQSTGDERFVRDETSYKQRATRDARELLSERELRDLLARGEHAEMLARIQKIGRTTNLLYNSAPTQGDLNILHVEGLDKAAFLAAFVDLLYGPGDRIARLDRYLGYVVDHGLPNKWTFCTYFTFLLDPDHAFFVRPSVSRWMTEALGGPTWQRAPSAAYYRELVALAEGVREAMADYGVGDLRDVQSVVWCAYRAEQAQAKEEREVRAVREETDAYTERTEAVNYWKIAPGDHAQAWDDMWEQGYIGLGWDGMPDLTGMSREAFESVRDRVAAEFGWSTGNQSGVNQLWTFYNDVHLGDYVIANNGTSEIVGIGRITGEYYFVPGEPYSDRRAVEWYDTTRRAISEGGWRRTVVQLDAAKFEELAQATPIEERSLAEPFATIFRDWDEAEWFFDLAQELLTALGMPDRATESVTISMRSAGRSLKVILGERSILELQRSYRLAVVLCGDDARDLVDVMDRREMSDYAGGPTGMTRCTVDRQGIAERTDLEDAIRRSYPSHREYAAHWPSSPHRAAHRPELERAVYDAEFRHKLLSQGLTGVSALDRYFTERTFDLLDMLNAEPTYATYDARRDEFREHLIEPFQQLMRDVAAALPESITSVVETEKRIFARIPKNDFGQGGAWPFYWGAFYPQGGRRIADGQLAIWINHKELNINFFVGEYGDDARRRIADNAALLDGELRHALDQRLFSGEFGSTGSLEHRTVSLDVTLDDLLEGLGEPESRVQIELTESQVVSMDRDELRNLVDDAFQAYFPLVLASILEDAAPAIRAYLGEEEPNPPVKPALPLADIAAKTSFPEGELAAWVGALHRKGQAILYGPPGTGKTFVAQLLADHLIGGGDGFKRLVQFHPAYAYEDFVEGIRPKGTGKDELSYPVVPGVFRRFCAEARKREGTCVLIIDEINRANLARVFGELMYLLEYRDQAVELAVSAKEFSIPGNVRILGTMNTADRSIALVDHALRRRFAFIALRPQYDVLRANAQTGVDMEALIALLERINNDIADANYSVGISFFLGANLAANLPSIWRMEIEPYLDEYFWGQADRVEPYRWDKVAAKVLSAHA